MALLERAEEKRQGLLGSWSCVSGWSLAPTNRCRRAPRHQIRWARAAAAGVQVDTVGVRDIASGDTLNTMAGLTIIDREVTFPPTAKDGEVFAWDYYAESLNPVKLIIMRANGKQLELVGESPMSIPRQLGLNRLELPEPIPIRWRDMMGLYQPEAGPVSFRKIRNYKRR